MPSSISSRSSSIFTLGTSVSSCTSYPISPAASTDYEKRPVKPAATPLVLRWKPLLLSTAFRYNVSTHIHFRAFPPHDLRRPLFDQLSIDVAHALLREHMSLSTLSFFAQPESTASRLQSIPFPRGLPQELVAALTSDQWTYFSIISTAVPLGIGKLSTNFDHQVAFRPVDRGVERYIFGPAGLCIHSTCRIHDAGHEAKEQTPRETLYLWEETEIICNKALKRWTRSLVAAQIAASHELFRSDWDTGMQEEWSLLKIKRSVDLLA